MTRAPCSSDEKADPGVKKGPWTPDEDQKLMAYIQCHGHGSWRSLPVNAGLQRCGKSCRLRWTNYLRPDIKRGRFSQEEDRMIVHLHALLGNRWSAIASHLPRRTDNEIKNYWNTHLKKRLLQMGIDPVTHSATAVAEDVDQDLDQLDGRDILSALPRPGVSSTLSHISQWECARAEAEARLSRQSWSSPPTTEFVPSSCAPQQSSAAAFGAVINPEAAQDASTTFMSSWKAQVTATLRPSFGVVELDKGTAAPAPNSVNIQSCLRDWEFPSLQQPTPTSPTPFPTCGDSPIDFPDFASPGAVSEVVSPQYSTASYALPSSAQITERLLASRATFTSDSSLVLPPPSKLPSFPLLGEFGDSPTSTLLGPDYDSSYANSPCVSSNSTDSFDFLAVQSLGLVHQANDHASCTSVDNIFPGAEPSFWTSVPHQQPSITESARPQPSDPSYLLLPELNTGFPKSSSILLSQVGVPNNIPIPQFDFLC